MVGPQARRDPQPEALGPMVSRRFDRRWAMVVAPAPYDHRWQLEDDWALPGMELGWQKKTQLASAVGVRAGLGVRAARRLLLGSSKPAQARSPRAGALPCWAVRVVQVSAIQPQQACADRRRLLGQAPGRSRPSLTPLALPVAVTVAGARRTSRAPPSGSPCRRGSSPVTPNRRSESEESKRLGGGSR